MRNNGGLNGGTGGVRFELESESGIRCLLEWDEGLRREVALMIEFGDEVFNSERSGLLSETWCRSVEFDVASNRMYSPEANHIGNTLDHNAGQWGTWVGRPLIGQWLKDIQLQ